MRSYTEIIHTAISNHQQTVVFEEAVSAAQVATAIHDILMDNPNLFWFNNVYTYNVASHHLQFDYPYSRNEITGMQAIIDSKLLDDLSLYKNGQYPDVQKALAVYRKLSQIPKPVNLQATSDNDITRLSLFDIVAHHIGGQCAVAKMAQYMFVQLGIPVYLVKGMLSGTSETHYWNIVVLDGQPYHFDASKNTPYTQQYFSKVPLLDEVFIDNINYGLFCVSEETILQIYDHISTNFYDKCTVDLSLQKIKEALNAVAVCQKKTSEQPFNPIEEPCEYKFSLCPNDENSSADMERCVEKPDMQSDVVPCLSETVESDWEQFTDDEVPETYELSPSVLDTDNNALFDMVPGTYASVLGDSGYFSRLNRILDKKLHRPQTVYTSVYAPTEVRNDSHFLIDIFLHQAADAEKMQSLAKAAQPDATLRYNTPLDIKVQKGEIINLSCELFYKQTLLKKEQKSVKWQGRLSRCTIDYYLDKQYDEGNIFCKIHLSLNGAPLGEMSFIMNIVSAPRNLHVQVDSKKYEKVFISYSVKDLEQVRPLAFAYRQQGILYFFDKQSLKAGDVYMDKIYQHIDDSDLFVLCWSKNAATSTSVEKERHRAMTHAFPQVSEEEATLSICPVNIQPHAELPEDMKGIYHFEEI